MGIVGMTIVFTVMVYFWSFIPTGETDSVQFSTLQIGVIALELISVYLLLRPMLEKRWLIILPVWLRNIFYVMYVIFCIYSIYTLLFLPNKGV